jgi:hypothetical protein
MAMIVIAWDSQSIMGICERRNYKKGRKAFLYCCHELRLAYLTLLVRWTEQDTIY